MLMINWCLFFVESFRMRICFLLLFCLITYCLACGRWSFWGYGSNRKERLSPTNQQTTKPPYVEIIHVKTSLDNCDCDGYEQRNPGSGPRKFLTKCTMRTDRTKQNNCKFKGNPHNCKDYIKTPVLFYQKLIEVIAPFQCNVTNLTEKTCPTETMTNRRICPDSPFTPE